MGFAEKDRYREENGSKAQMKTMDDTENAKSVVAASQVSQSKSYIKHLEKELKDEK